MSLLMRVFGPPIVIGFILYTMLVLIRVFERIDGWVNGRDDE